MATALGAAFGSILMGSLSNLPFAVAAGMGTNFILAGQIKSGALTPGEVFSAVLLGAVLMMVISATGARKYLVKAMPKEIRSAIGIAIGAYIAYIGLGNMLQIGAIPDGNKGFVPPLGTQNIGS
jgi:AGZA family xanthine/uracil permease-like MFS transporter